MRRWLLPATWLLFFLALAISLGGWGGLAYVPEVGDAVGRRAPEEAFLAATYLAAGRALVRGLGLVDPARRFAEARFQDSLASVRAEPALAVDRVFAGMDMPMRYGHYGTPWLLALAIGLGIVRPRQVRTFTRRK